MPTQSCPEFLRPRRCLREPITEIWEAADRLDQAATAHVRGNASAAHRLLLGANLPVVREWIESLWGSERSNPEQPRYRRFRVIESAPPRLPKERRVPFRMPTMAEQAAVISRYGRHCVFCGIPVIRRQVRVFLCNAYPDAVTWGPDNPSQHAAFQALWLQFDHLVPHSRGGGNTLENIIVTCAGCNFGRMDNTIEELGLLDPRPFPVKQSTWDGLERVLQSKAD